MPPASLDEPREVEPPKKAVESPQPSSADRQMNCGTPRKPALLPARVRFARSQGYARCR